MELQRSLHEQMTGEALAVSPDATAEKQLKQLRSAGVSERWLVVLDGRFVMVHSVVRMPDLRVSFFRYLAPRAASLFELCRPCLRV